MNKSHRWLANHKPNKTTVWVESTCDQRIAELKQIISNGFEQQLPKVSRRYDANAKKWRTINEPRQWPDQYVHHALIQVISPLIMRGMDTYCCGSIQGRGPHYARKAIERWMSKDKRGTKYCATGDVRHFYDSLKPEIVMSCMKRLIKDSKVLDLIWRIVKGGILIGSYTSQWFANAVLQPLDHFIREGNNGIKHYVRYMDNLTIFGPNKRKLHRLIHLISEWLEAHDLSLKGDWQVFPVASRLPNAVGYRYGNGYTLIRKHQLLRIKRALAKFKRKTQRGITVTSHEAAGLISRLGQLKHCNNRNLYKMLFGGQRIIRKLKSFVKNDCKNLNWSMYMLQIKQVS